MAEPKEFNVISDWFQKEDNKEEIKRKLQSNLDLFVRLEKILAKLKFPYESVARDITNPNWINAVAFAEGYKAAINDVYKCLPKDQK